MVPRSATIARNILKWTLICTAIGLLIGTGFAAAGAYTVGHTLFSSAGLMLAAAKGFLTGQAAVPFLFGGIAAGAVVGTGKGIIEAQRNCDTPACETERMTPQPKGSYEDLYRQMGIEVGNDHAQKLAMGGKSPAITRL